MKKKIFLFYLLLIVIALGITGFFTTQISGSFYNHEVEQRLINTAYLIRYQLLNQHKGTDVDYNKLAKEYSGILNTAQFKSEEKKNTRITFIDINGKVIGESDKDYKEMSSHNDRKEIKEALLYGIGKDLRLSETLKVNHLYIAIPVKEKGVIIRVSVPLLQLKEIETIVLTYTIIGILAGLAITTLLAFKFSSSITKPISEFISVSKEISLGNYSKRVKIKTKDELNIMSKAFNEMALKLERTIADLKDKNIKVDTIINSMQNGIIAVDNNYRILLINSIACQMFNIKHSPNLIGSKILNIVRNNKLNSLLKQTIVSNTSIVNEITISSGDNKILRLYTNPIKSLDNEKLNSGGIVFIQDITNIKKLEQIRTDFVSNVTHELKTPLTSIRGFVETLRGGAINDHKVANKFLEIIDIEAERLYILINDILQLSEIESKNRDTNINEHNLKSIVEETIVFLNPVAHKKGIIITYEVDNSIVIKVNKDRIKQMLINLIDNGIKYNTDNGKVMLNAYKRQGKVIINIKDTGIGIPPEHIPRIFERFYRVDKGRSRNMGGTGLGLSIVKHVVNLYNGDIKVFSSENGTEFIIQLPL